MKAFMNMALDYVTATIPRVVVTGYNAGYQLLAEFKTEIGEL